MKREALVVGINQYPFLDEDLSTPAKDAEAVARLLEEYGNFQVQRLPNPQREGQIDVKGKEIDAKGVLKQEELEAAITRLFQPKSSEAADTAVLFFAGHGLQKEEDNQTEGFLATSEVRPEQDRWGISLQWLRQLLQESPVRQQIVWLDCCHSGELFNVEQTDLGEYKKGRDRFFVAAAREFQAAFEESASYGVLTEALVQGLDPNNRSDDWVTNFTLTDFLEAELKDAPQHPVVNNSGGEILLTGKEGVKGKICPYQGLDYFTAEDAQYFYGRKKLTEQLLEKVGESNFVAVLGASGSGKSSVVRAGLLHQLQQGAIPGSEEWKIYPPFTPTEHPLKSLAETIGESLSQEGELPIDLEKVIKSISAQRVVLVVDQFEEAFTVCEDDSERQQFFECLMSAVGAGLADNVSHQQTTSQQNPPSSQKLCLVLVMRADFLSKCGEQDYAGLAKKIEQNLVMVTPMTGDELTEAITQPAEQVGLELDRELVNQMIDDVEGSPGSLPLLEYTLTQLWQQRSLARLTINDYTRLGGVKEALSKQADQVYQSLSKEQQQTAKRIFLELTRLGEGTEDTRRQVSLKDLVTSESREAQVEQVVKHLADAKLVVTGENQVVNIAHEALIRHWHRLRQWIDQNREAIRIERRIEAAAQEWENNDHHADYLLQGRRLNEAQDYRQEYAHLGLLSNVAKEFIDKSIQRRRRNRWLGIGTVVAVFAALAGLSGWAVYQWREALIGQVQASRRASEISWRSDQEIEALFASIKAGKPLEQDLLLQPPFSPRSQLRNQVILSLHRAVYGVRERKSLGHQDVVWSVRFSPDGTRIATASRDGTAKLWDTASGKVLHSFEHQDEVISVTFSPDGSRIATASEDYTAKLWDTASGKVLHRFEHQELHRFAHKHGVRSVRFSPDGTKIATASVDNTAKLWDTASGKELHSFEHQDDVMSVRFSPDGTKIATASRDGTAKLWDTASGRQLHSFKHPYEVNNVRFSPDGTKIATASRDGTATLWALGDTASRGQLHSFEHEYLVNSVSFSLDGTKIATASRDNTAKLWNISSGRQLHSFEHQEDVTSVSFSPDGTKIATASLDNTAKLWDTASGKVLHSFKHPYDVNSVRFSPDGTRIATASSDNTAKLWDTASGKQLHSFEHQDCVESVRFSPDGTKIATASLDDTAKLWDTASGRQLHSFKHQYDVHSVSFSPDGTKIATASADNTAKLWDTASGKELHSFEHQYDVHSVSFSPDGTKIATASRDNTAKLWDTASGKELHSFEHQDWVWSVTFSPDGSRIATASRDNTAKLWPAEGVNELLVKGCKRVREYLENDPEIENKQEKQQVCQGIGGE